MFSTLSDISACRGPLPSCRYKFADGTPVQGAALQAFSCADSNFWTGDLAAHDDPFDIRNAHPLSAAEQQFRGYGVSIAWEVDRMYTPSQTAEMHAAIVAAFDSDGSGKLDRAELLRVLLKTDPGFVRSPDAAGWAAGGICPPTLALAFFTSKASYDDPTLGSAVLCSEADAHCRQSPTPVQCGSDAMTFFASSPCCREPSTLPPPQRLPVRPPARLLTRSRQRSCVSPCVHGARQPRLPTTPLQAR